MSLPASHGPSYPLSREEFRRALATGHGRVKLHVERFGAVEFREEILDAATACKAYDPQCEGTRADWLADLCLAAGIEHEVVALPVPEKHWDRNQRAALLKELAARNVPGAREALYACFGPVEHLGDWYASEELIRLDGEAGLLFVVRALGASLLERGITTASDYELSVFDETHGEGAGRKFLDSLAPSDSGVRAYLAAIDHAASPRAHAATAVDRPRRSLEEVLEAIRTNTEEYMIGWVGNWGRRANREEQQRLLEFLLATSAPREMEGALRCLAGGGLPPLHPRIFELTRHEDRQVRFWAGRVLSKHSLPGARAFGLEALARGDLVVGLEILTRSAQVDDVETLVAALRPLDDSHQEHSMGFGIFGLFEHSPEVRDARLALHAYERTPCMNCRESAVEFLVDRHEAPPWLLEECAFDANENIHELTSAAREPPIGGQHRGGD